MHKLFCILAVLVGLGACAETPETTYYLFPVPPVETRLPYSGGTIAVREISLPLYARQAQIASISEDGSVALSEDNRWADEPPRAATGALLSSLEQILDAPLVSEPWPPTVSPEYRIDVTVDRYIGDTRGGELEFSGQYRIFGADRGNATKQGSFAYRIPIAQPGYKALAQAHSDAVLKLAVEIAEAIPTTPGA